MYYEGGESMKKLWYGNEACVWNEALPIGNGRIGAMVFSGAIVDKIQINEDTLWSGYPDKCIKKHDLSEVSEIRELIKNKKYSEATEKTSDTMFNVHSDGYVPYGNLYVEVVCQKNDVSDYRRELDLKNAVVKTCYAIEGNKIEKEVFTSLKDDLMVMNIKSENKLKYHIYQAVDLEHSVKTVDDEMITVGRCPTEISMYTNTVEYDNNESIHFKSQIFVISNDKVYGGGNSLWCITDELTILFSLKTSFNGYNNMPVSEGKAYINACGAVI